MNSPQHASERTERGLNDQSLKLSTASAWRAHRLRFRPNLSAAAAAGDPSFDSGANGATISADPRTQCREDKAKAQEKKDGEEEEKKKKKKQRQRRRDRALRARAGEMMKMMMGDVDLGHVVDVCRGGDEVVEVKKEEMKAAYRGKMFEVRSRPGFVHAPAALSERVQKALANRARKVYCQKPHATNVDAHMHRPKNKRPRLSWASVGFHFDWTNRRYKDEDRSPFPQELSKLTSMFADAIGKTGFEAQAGIINFYKPQGNMGSHVDDSEDDKEHPVVSVTLGLPAIFLVGTKDREEEPVAVLLRPGDVMMLDGESRLCYHGIAAVLPCQVPTPSGFLPDLETQIQVEDIFDDSISSEELCPFENSQEELEDIESYLSSCRVNLNMRQVLLKGRSTLLNTDCHNEHLKHAGMMQQSN